MPAQIVVHTNAHPYHIQVLSFWLSLGPVLAIIALLLLVRYWNIRRNRKKVPAPKRPVHRGTVR